MAAFGISTVLGGLQPQTGKLRQAATCDTPPLLPPGLSAGGVWAVPPPRSSPPQGPPGAFILLLLLLLLSVSAPQPPRVSFSSVPTAGGTHGAPRWVLPPPAREGGLGFLGVGVTIDIPPLQSVPHGADGGAARWVRTPNWAEGSRRGGGSDFWEGGPPSVSPSPPPLCSSPIGHNLSCVSYKHPSVRGSLVGGEVGAAPSTVRCPPRQCCIGIWNRSQALVQGEPLRGGPRGGCGAEQPLGAAVRGGFASLPAPTSAFGWGCGGAGTDRGGGG